MSDLIKELLMSTNIHKDAEKELRKLGIDIKNNDGTYKSIYEVLNELAENKFTKIK